MFYLYIGPYLAVMEGPNVLGMLIKSGRLPLIPFGNNGPGTFKIWSNFLTFEEKKIVRKMMIKVRLKINMLIVKKCSY